ncbi:MAG: stage V sporulation protein K [Desulfitibacter sp. BRH_c19]|nr:MAG: stage V sporulation protein K [Desulfitibacter sp. BRH_c19]
MQNNTNTKANKKTNSISQNTKIRQTNSVIDGQDVLKELDVLVGLNEVKLLIKELRAYVLVQKARSKEKLTNEAMVLHMVFKGNPGTGKTTVARILGSFFKEMGILSKGHLVEVERADLVGEYIGHTAMRARESIKNALGGVLFVDEAYSLARGGDKDFGREAIDCLVKGMEDNRDNIILILAGYKNEMEKLIRTNPGLRSRFPIHIEFPDYTLEELVKIAEEMLTQRDYYFSIDAKIKLETVLKKHIASGHAQIGNARMVRNIVEKSIRKQAYRLVEKNTMSRDDLLIINANDIYEDLDYSSGIETYLKKVK